ncbi:uncharacterized protein BXIN_1444 [Babesia sp. Xinjiang]|uniref:uncharacterized protein n=1 Tax=Babesia sp. Xinjiang TaxID=462227 RepID=UPI000A2438E7|nr:uncharacterized protein BXIN_1444 [Babesia sp. Xinjiang]ORM40103.1 hypothetical protein BXIN_1444 [Babesia sp. Xinjiang]
MIPLVSLSLRRCLYRSNVSVKLALPETFATNSHFGKHAAIRQLSSDAGNTARDSSTKQSDDSRWMKKPEPSSESSSSTTNVTDGKFFFDADVENLSPEQQQQKEELIRELTKKLSGPLADENGNVPTGDDRPIAIEVDGPSHFYANSTKYTAYTKLKHRLLTRMGYKVLHVPYFEWRRLRGAKEREEYMREKLKEEPTEWIDPEDEAFYNKRMEALRRQTETVIQTLEPESSK